MMKIETPNGYLYHLVLGKLEQTTLILGEHWDDLILHYSIDHDDQIVVNLDGDKEFFRAVVFDKDSKEKKVINEPGYSLSKKLYILYDAEVQVNGILYPLAKQGK